MRIFIIGPAHPLRGGGISTFNERMAQAFLDAGHEVEIYSFSLQYPSFLFPGKSQYTQEPPPENLIIHSTINSVNPWNWIRQGRKIAARKPDLVIIRFWIPFMGPCLGTLARIIKNNGHSRILCLADNITPHESRPGDGLFLRYFLPPVDRFITMSRAVLRDLESRTRKPSMYLPHPIYDNYGDPVTRTQACEHLGLDPRFRYLMFFGFIRAYKGLDLLLEAMALLKNAAQEFRLLIAGEYYEDREKYDRLIQERGIEDRIVRFEHFIPNQDIRYYFGAADLLVLPYRSATQSGIIPLAYHFEKPAIVTRVGGLDEVIIDGKTGYLTDANPEAIATRIQQFLQQPSDFPWQKHIREEKKKYSWDAFINAMLEFSFPKTATRDPAASPD